jgi:hypothetical protein
MRVRGLCVHHRPMTYQRDPLSVEHDPVASDVIARAITRHRRAGSNQRVSRWVPVRVDNQVTDVVRDAGGLSRNERAFQRSLYHDKRIHKPRKNDGGPWSLELRWAPAPLLPGASRGLEVRVWRDTEARRFMTRQPKPDQWQHNRDLQSGGIGSGRERFPA